MPNRHKLLEKAVIIVIAALMPLFFAVDSDASGDEPPRLEADCSVEIIGEPEINEPFEVVFTFTPDHDLIHTKGIPDTARLYISENIRYVSGDTIWTGFLERGNTYTLTAWYILEKPKWLRIQGCITAIQAMGLVYGVGDYTDNGVKAYNYSFSRGIDLTGGLENVIILNRPIINPEDSTVLYYVKDTIPKPSFMEPIIAQPPLENDVRHKKTVIKTRTREPHRRLSPEDNFIKIDSACLYKGDTIIIKKNGPNIIGPDIGNKFKLPDEKSFNMKKISNGVFLITPIDFDTLLQIEYLDTTFTVPVEYRSDYYIQGNASFVDNNGVIQDCEYTTVVLLAYNFEWQLWELVTEWETDYDGYFNFVFVDNPVVAVGIWSQNPVTTVTYTEDHYLDYGDPLYVYEHYYIIENPYYYNIDIPDENLRISHPDTAGAFNILNTLLMGEDYLLFDMGISNTPPQNFSVWDVQDDSRGTSSYNGFTVNGIPGFYFASKANRPNYNWDEWDECIILHEYGHHMMKYVFEDIPETGGQWNYYFPTFGANNLNKAMSEGWAYFYSAVVLNDHTCINSAYYMPIYVDRYFEYSMPDPAYYNTSYDYPENPPWAIPQVEGSHVPGSIVTSLWDIFDYSDDDNYYIGSDIWGHNNDHNMNEYWQGIQWIWDVFMWHDPQPYNMDHNFCWNIDEFVDGWRKLGYPMDETFTNILEAHGIRIFIPGDTNDDNIVNLFDITFLAAYLYKNGPPPDHMSAGDVNADCIINIFDPTYMINAIYKSGPEILVGCHEYYP